jgi:hypothetical protein
MADREGRLEYRPKRIKAEVLPYDNGSIEKMVDELQCKNFLQVYSVNGNNYINIVNFRKHQNPHVRESESSCPAPDEHSAEHSLGNAEHGSSPADSPIPHPDSPILIPTPVDDKSPTCPHEEIISLYHKILPELPAVKIWTQKRQAHLRSRWKESAERQCLEWWEKYFQKIKQSPFLTGNVTDFKASLEWVVNQSNMVKILEGKYDGGNGNGGIRTARSDPRDKTLQPQWESEVAAIIARREAAKQSPRRDPGRDADKNDAQDFSGIGPTG